MSLFNLPDPFSKDLSDDKRKALSQGLLAFGASVLSREDNRAPLATIARSGLLGTGAYRDYMDEQEQRKLAQEQEQRSREEYEFQKRERERQDRIRQAYSQYGNDPTRLQDEVSKIDPQEGLRVAQSLAGVRSLADAQERQRRINEVMTQYGGNPAELVPRLMAIDPGVASQVASTYRSMQPDAPSWKSGPQTVNPKTGRLESTVLGSDGSLRFVGPAAEAAPAEVMDPKAPWRNITDPKQRAMAQRQAMTAGGKVLEEMRQGTSKSNKRAELADEFGRLMSTEGTGPLKPLKSWFDGDVSRMQSITSELVPAMREPGSGSTSDFDARMFERGVMGVSKPEAGNRMIIQGIKTQAQLAKDEMAFYEDYLATYGHTNGAQQVWQTYLDTNPIFDPASPDEVKLNSKRLSYSDWMALQNGSATVK